MGKAWILNALQKIHDKASMVAVFLFRAIVIFLFGVFQYPPYGKPR
jgi:hypothetical protein